MIFFVSHGGQHLSFPSTFMSFPNTLNFQRPWPCEHPESGEDTGTAEVPQLHVALHSSLPEDQGHPSDSLE